MARIQGYNPVGSVVKGILTEATELNFPPDASVDEDNCELLIGGNRRRRLGLDWDGSVSKNALGLSLSTVRDLAIVTYTWHNADNNPLNKFHIVQIGATLYFFDAIQSPIGQKKSFTVDLSTFKTAAATTTQYDRVFIDSGDGKAFVVSKSIEPFYITYDEDADTISTTQIECRIRDVIGVDDGLDNDEEPESLSTLHNYNLLNQGWGATALTGGNDPLSGFAGGAGDEYPANNKLWWVGKDSTETFSKTFFRKSDGGTGLAPRGHFILDPFNLDRDTASGLSGITTETENERPQACAFFASRFFMGFKGGLYFSQIIDTDKKIGRFYQANDPTAEDNGELLPSDGGFIDIPSAGDVLSIFVSSGALILFCSNGTWGVRGAERGFRADEFMTDDMSSIKIKARESVVDVEGTPFWWSDRGIYTISQNEVTSKLGVVSLTDQTIQSLYNGIKNKSNVIGHYDGARRRIIWLYEDEEIVASHKNKFNKALCYSIDLKAFYTWTFPALTDDTVDGWIAGVFESDESQEVRASQNVVDSTSDPVVDSSGTDIIAYKSPLTDRRNTFTKFLLIYTDDKVSYGVSFGYLKNGNFVDWEGHLTGGVDYQSFFITGYDLQGDIMRFKQNPYLFLFFKKTETGFVRTAPLEADYLNPSGCSIQTRWEFSDHENSGRWSNEVEGYKFRRAYIPSLSNTNFDNGFPITISKLKVRGKGKAISMKFTSVSGKDFNFLGWGMKLAGNQDV